MCSTDCPVLVNRMKEYIEGNDVCVLVGVLR